MRRDRPEKLLEVDGAPHCPKLQPWAPQRTLGFCRAALFAGLIVRGDPSLLEPATRPSPRRIPEHHFAAHKSPDVVGEKLRQLFQDVDEPSPPLEETREPSDLRVCPGQLFSFQRECARPITKNKDRAQESPFKSTLEKWTLRGQSSVQSLPSAKPKKEIVSSQTDPSRVLRKTASAGMPVQSLKTSWERSFTESNSSIESGFTQKKESVRELPPLPAQSSFYPRKLTQASTPSSTVFFEEKLRAKRESSRTATASIRIDVNSLSRKVRQNLDKLLSSAGKAGF